MKDIILIYYYNFFFLLLGRILGVSYTLLPIPLLQYRTPAALRPYRPRRELEDMALLDLIARRQLRRAQVAIAIGVSDAQLKALSEKPEGLNYVQARKLAELCAVSMLDFTVEADLNDDQTIDFLRAEASEHVGMLASSPGSRLKARRLELEMTQEELSQKSGVKQATISNVETAVAFPRIDTLEKLARALEMNVRDLIPDAQLQKYIKQATKRHLFQTLNQLRSNG